MQKELIYYYNHARKNPADLKGASTANLYNERDSDFKEMSQLNKEDIINALRRVKDADTGKDVVSTGLVGGIVIRGKNVGFAIETSIKNPKTRESLRSECEKTVKSLPGVEHVTAVLTAAKSPVTPEEEASAIAPVAGVRHIIAVASGKGGVGKSTVSFSMAVALNRMGYKVGIVDADIYGPSIPHLMGLNEKPEIDNSNKMVPLENHGIKSISMGYLVDPKQAAVWRGPMATKALYQLFRGTAWKDIDYLIVDMPPGTGDIQLSLAKNFPVAGAVLVSTPQELALLDVQKAADMFRKVNIPILGIIENMSYFEDSASKNRTYIFGEGGVKKFAAEADIDFLGEIPIHPDIGKASDNGIVVDNSTLIPSDIFDKVIQKVES